MSTRRALFFQSIRGPILLITLGSLFAIHQAGILSFSRTWPLLIIVIGVMKLLERYSEPVPALQSEYPARPYPPHGTYPAPQQPVAQQQPQQSPRQVTPGRDLK